MHVHVHVYTKRRIFFERQIILFDRATNLFSNGEFLLSNEFLSGQTYLLRIYNVGQRARKGKIRLVYLAYLILVSEQAAPGGEGGADQ